MGRLERLTARVATSLTLTILGSVVAGGCGLLPDDSSPARPISSSASRSPSSSASPSVATSAPEAKAPPDENTSPARACDVVTAQDKANLKMSRAKNQELALEKSCALSNTPESSPPRHFLHLKFSYSTAPAAVGDATAYAKTFFARRKASDFRQPNPFGGPPSVKGTINQTGDSKLGSDFEEGYYVFYKTDVAGAKEGNGLAVIRKGSVVITILASGNVIPGQRVVDSRPIGNEVAQRMIDVVADHVIQGIKPVS